MDHVTPAFLFCYIDFPYFIMLSVPISVSTTIDLLFLYLDSTIGFSDFILWVFGTTTLPPALPLSIDTDLEIAFLV